MYAALISNPRRLLAALLTLLASVGVAVGSGASFASQTVNPANTFTSGTLLHTNSKNGAAVVTGSNLKPGDTRTGEVTITNTGSLAGDISLSEINATNGFSAGSLKVTVTDKTNGTTVYAGDLGGLGTKALGSFASKEARTYVVTVALSATAPNADQGKTASADLRWDETATATP